MASIFEIGVEHLPGVMNGDVEALRSLFTARFTNWGKPYSYEEGFTIGLFDDVEQDIMSHVAFELVRDAVNLALSQRDPAAFICAVSLILNLVSATYTTEVPGDLKRLYPDLVKKAYEFNSDEANKRLVEIARYYRHAL